MGDRPPKIFKEEAGEIVVLGVKREGGVSPL